MFNTRGRKICLIDKPFIHPELQVKRQRPKSIPLPLNTTSLDNLNQSVIDILNKPGIDLRSLLEQYLKHSKICDVCQQLIHKQRTIQCHICEDFYHMNCVSQNRKLKTWICSRCKGKKAEILSKYENVNCAECNLKVDDDSIDCMKCKKEYHENCFKADIKFPICHNCSQSNIQPDDNEMAEGIFINLKVQELRSQKKSERQFILPTPIKDLRIRKECIQSILDALANQNIEFSDNLHYELISKKENNPNLEPFLQKLDYVNHQTFLLFKQMSSKKLYAPLKVEWHEKQGYVVRAMANIEKNTILCEYAGDVDRLQNQVFSKSDSIMTLLQTTRSLTTLIVLPLKHANIAKYISGINNKKENSKLKQQNVVSKRYNIGGEARVILLAKREIKQDEILYYDYNEGGFNTYDTEDFE